MSQLMTTQHGFESVDVDSSRRPGVHRHTPTDGAGEAGIRARNGNASPAPAPKRRQT